MRIGDRRLVIVSDFDGTLTEKDIGNELCILAAKDKFTELQAKYKKRELTLQKYQELMWTGLPLGKSQMRSLAPEIANLRPGVREFLVECQRNHIPVFVSSCGILDYIESVLDTHLNSQLRTSIREIRSNTAEYSANSLTKLNFFEPFDKGAYCDEIRGRYLPDSIFLVGIGNGTSDRGFLGHVDKLFATEALISYCESQNYPHHAFKDFFEIASGFFSSDNLGNVKL